MLEHGKETASENDRLPEGIWRRDLVCNMVGIELRHHITGRAALAPAWELYPHARSD